MNIEQYQRLTKQAVSLVESEPNLIANLANVSALLNMELEDLNWVGFYLMDNDELVLGPFKVYLLAFAFRLVKVCAVQQCQQIACNVFMMCTNLKDILLVMRQVTLNWLFLFLSMVKWQVYWILIVHLLADLVKLISKD